VSLPVAFAAMAVCFAELRDGMTKFIPAALSSALIWYECIGLSTAYDLPHKEQYREASRFIADRAVGPQVILTTWKPNVGFYNHYLRQFMRVPYELVSVSSPEDALHFCQSDKIPDKFFVFQHVTQRDLSRTLIAECSKRNVTLLHEEIFRGVIVDVLADGF
jgi:hypothetical protein